MAKTSKVSAKKSATSKSTSKSKASSKSPAVNGDQLIAYYRDMLNIRRFEEKAGQLYGMGLIGGFCHLYIGQEAVVVGMTQAGTDDDSVITSYRDHGHMLACGMDPKGVMAELTGRRGGYSKGKGGSMHMFSREKKFFGGHGIVGAQIPLGTGLAFAHKYKGDNGVCHAYMGDGAVNQGQIYESFNMAALWNLPVVYVIENNKYGMGTSIERASSNVELSERGNAHDIPGQSVNGMDVLDVVEKGDAALEHARSGKGPMILEMKTYRYRGHSMSDPAKYRSKEEVQKMRKESDPIDNLRHTILEGGFATEDQLKDIDKEIKSIVTAAAEYAQQSPEPDELELYTDILKEA
ncbi:pyruvate dehydrogenase (acetyl-transferring) E1 component subunit alpha [Rhodospirillales bacterium]|nr:pyruvate dehydrogenase (acetyl-transferring) E1 component subunit alpha [Rhodospirillales bacterium]